MLRPARSTGNLLDISSYSTSTEDENIEKDGTFNSDNLKWGKEHNNTNGLENTAPGRKFCPVGSRTSKSYTSAVSSKIKKHNVKNANSNISTSNVNTVRR